MSTSMKEFRDLSVAQLEKTHSIPVARKNIARILTALAEKGGQTTQSK